MSSVCPWKRTGDIYWRTAGTEAVEFPIWLSMKGDKQRVVQTFLFSRKVGTIWVSQILQQQNLRVRPHHFSATLLDKEKYLAFICEYFKLCGLFFVAISNNSVWAFPLTEPRQILSDTHFDDSYCYSSFIRYSVLWNVKYFTSTFSNL